jgi:DNA-binding NarL/FixJ family response regulator
MRVFLADDQAKVRAALRLLLEQEPGLSVVGEVTEAKDLLVQVQVTQPDVVLLDWELPGLRATEPWIAPSASPWAKGPGQVPRHDSGDVPSLPKEQISRQRLLSALHSLGCPLKIIALSGHLEAREEALGAGVDAFVSKGDPPERLLTTLRTVGVTNEI